LGAVDEKMRVTRRGVEEGGMGAPLSLHSLLYKAWTLST
jgi:hypothetical protein